MSDKYPKGSGAMFQNTDKKSENHPDLRGNIEITGDQIRKLIEMGKAGLEPKLQVAGWWRQAKSSGQTYLSLSTEAYVKEEQQPQYPPQQTQMPPQVQVPPQAAPQPMAQPAAVPQQQEFPNEDIPF